jgi:hypothetical protein
MIVSPKNFTIEAKTMASKSPSHSRRGRLQADLTVPSVSNFFALKNYYEAADMVYKQFQESLWRSAEDGKTRGVSLDDAYVYGKRYCTFVTLEIPKHSYYKTPQCSAQRNLHHKQVDQVLTQLEEVVVRKMDEEEEARAQQEPAERARQEQEQSEALKTIFRLQFSTPMVTATTSTNVKVSALNKHETGSMILFSWESSDPSATARAKSSHSIFANVMHLSLGLGTNIFVTAEQ